MAAAAAFMRRSWREGLGVYWTLFKLAFPLLCAVKLLDDAFGIVALLGGWLAPLMNLAGLPGDAGIVLAAAMLVNIYAGILLAVSLWAELALSTAQITVLMTMTLVAHALPVELRIVQKAGMRIGAAFALRFFGAFLLGAILHTLYAAGAWLQEPASLTFALSPPADDGWRAWLINEARNWGAVFVIVQALVAFVNLLKISRAETWLIRICAPLFRRIGIGDEAAAMAMVGLLLGLSYGGALLIRQGNAGHVSRRDALCVLALLCLCHSVIEDTLLVMALGAHWSGVLAARALFALVFMALFFRLVRRLDDAGLDKIAAPRAAGAPALRT